MVGDGQSDTRDAPDGGLVIVVLNGKLKHCATLSISLKDNVRLIWLLKDYR